MYKDYFKEPIPPVLHTSFHNHYPYILKMPYHYCSSAKSWMGCRLQPGCTLILTATLANYYFTNINPNTGKTFWSTDEPITFKNVDKTFNVFGDMADVTSSSAIRDPVTRKLNPNNEIYYNFNELWEKYYTKTVPYNAFLSDAKEVLHEGTNYSGTVKEYFGRIPEVEYINELIYHISAKQASYWGSCNSYYSGYYGHVTDPFYSKTIPGANVPTIYLTEFDSSRTHALAKLGIPFGNDACKYTGSGGHCYASSGFDQGLVFYDFGFGRCNMWASISLPSFIPGLKQLLNSLRGYYHWNIGNYVNCTFAHLPDASYKYENARPVNSVFSDYIQYTNAQGNTKTIPTFRCPYSMTANPEVTILGVTDPGIVNLGYCIHLKLRNPHSKWYLLYNKSPINVYSKYIPNIILRPLEEIYLDLPLAVLEESDPITIKTQNSASDVQTYTTKKYVEGSPNMLGCSITDVLNSVKAGTSGSVPLYLIWGDRVTFNVTIKNSNTFDIAILPTLLTYTHPRKGQRGYPKAYMYGIGDLNNCNKILHKYSKGEIEILGISGSSDWIGSYVKIPAKKSITTSVSFLFSDLPYDWSGNFIISTGSPALEAFQDITTTHSTKLKIGNYAEGLILSNKLVNFKKYPAITWYTEKSEKIIKGSSNAVYKTGDTTENALMTGSYINMSTAYKDMDIETPEEALAIDLSKIRTSVKSIKPNSNPNTLYYVNSSQTNILEALKNHNLVKVDSSKVYVTYPKFYPTDWVAEKITIDSNYNFYCPITFTANNVEFKVQMNEGNSPGNPNYKGIPFIFSVDKVTCDGKEIDWFKSDTDTNKLFWIRELEHLEFKTTAEEMEQDKFNLIYKYPQKLELYHNYFISVPGEYYGEYSLGNKTLVFTGTNQTFHSSSVIDCTPYTAENLKVNQTIRCGLSSQENSFSLFDVKNFKLITERIDLCGTTCLRYEEKVYKLNDSGTDYIYNESAVILKPFETYLKDFDRRYRPDEDLVEVSPSKVRTIHAQTDDSLNYDPLEGIYIDETPPAIPDMENEPFEDDFEQE